LSCPASSPASSGNSAMRAAHRMISPLFERMLRQSVPVNIFLNQRAVPVHQRIAFEHAVLFIDNPESASVTVLEAYEPRHPYQIIILDLLQRSYLIDVTALIRIFLPQPLLLGQRVLLFIGAQLSYIKPQQLRQTLLIGIRFLKMISCINKIDLAIRLNTAYQMQQYG